MTRFCVCFQLLDKMSLSLFDQTLPFTVLMYMYIYSGTCHLPQWLDSHLPKSQSGCFFVLDYVFLNLWFSKLFAMFCSFRFVTCHCYCISFLPSIYMGPARWGLGETDWLLVPPGKASKSTDLSSDYWLTAHD